MTYEEMTMSLGDQLKNIFASKMKDDTAVAEAAVAANKEKARKDREKLVSAIQASVISHIRRRRLPAYKISRSAPAKDWISECFYSYGLHGEDLPEDYDLFKDLVVWAHGEGIDFYIERFCGWGDSSDTWYTIRAVPL